MQWNSNTFARYAWNKGYTYKSGTYTFTYNNPWGSTESISANNLAKSMILVTKAEYGALITLK